MQNSLNVDRIIAHLLSLRGIENFDDAKNFFRPQYDFFHDPFLMKGMKAAVDRIISAFENKEKILIYGDYDVDGTTAVSLVYSFFKNDFYEIDYYIPDRYKEGYGISFAGIDFASDHGYSLIIALDCGIKAIDKIKYASDKNIDFIICDHHLPGDEIPKAAAVLDPKQKGCDYPYKELSGAGIGFKLICAYAIKNDLPLDECFQYLDLVAASIASDLVPITGENRILTYFGIEKINTSPRPGIKALLNINQLKSKVTVNNMVFMLGPRINAAGRMEHGSKAVELLICEDELKAEELAKSINETNTQRRDVDLGTTVEALQMAESDPVHISRKTTVLFNPTWHKGIVGIVASRMIEKYYRPTIILTESDGKITGSARSVREFDIYEALEKCAAELEQFGGHKFAAGLTLKKENLNSFRELFEKVVSKNITEDQLTPTVEIDLEISLDEINEKVLRILKQFHPHGPGNMTPIFCTRKIFDTGWGKVFGNNHLKVEVFSKTNPNTRFQAIAFDKGDYINFFQRKIPMDIVYKIQEQEFKGQTSIQLVIEEMKVSE